METVMIKKILFAVVIFALSTAILQGAIFYKTNYAKTEVETYTYDEYTLEVYEIGEPEWPFGKTHCRFILNKEKERVIKFDFTISDDGTRAGKDNFDIKWYEDKIEVVVNGSEQSDMLYRLNFDGSMSSMKLT